MIGNIPPNEINYRVMTARMDDLVRGTPCDVTAGLGAFGTSFGGTSFGGAGFGTPAALAGPAYRGFGIFRGPSLGPIPAASSGSGAFRAAPREPPGFSVPILFPDDRRLVR